MPLLLVFPLLLAVVVVLWIVLLPVGLVQRYRYGRARRRAQAWMVRANSWLLSLSALLLLAGAAIGQRWIAHALRDTGAGLLVGLAVGALGIAASRFERTPHGLYYTPNRWLVLALTALLAVRVGSGAWLAWRHWQSAPASNAWAAWFDQGGLLGVAAVLLGYYLAYTWGLRRRLPERSS